MTVRYYEPPPTPPPSASSEPTWTDPGPPPWQTAIRARRILRAYALRRKLARRRRWAFIFRKVSHFLKLRGH